ncbi:major facilitator superfamily domain-containing protein [Scleroderma yunnanense]
MSADEETPLLAQSTDEDQEVSSRTARTPLPWRQFSILLALQLVEPLTSQVIAPFLPQLIREIGITNGDESQVGYYVGLMHSLFFVTEACTIFHWSRLSDRIGRKPVLLIGIFGLSLSMYCFGLSKTFWGLVISRCLNGALNGNVGIMKSMIGELTDSTNIAHAFSFLPSTWYLGATTGPLIGGLLERPAEKFPGIFGNSTFLKEYPYFLPCSVPATTAAVFWLVGFFFLKETAKPQMTPMEYFFGRWRKFKASGHSSPVVEDDSLTCTRESPVPFRELLVAPVLVAAGSYASFALLDMAFRTVFPVYLSTPITMGGLGLNPSVIGTILALTGLGNGVFQILFFARLHDWLGAKILFLVTSLSFLPGIVLLPIINRVAQVYGLNRLIWLLFGIQILLTMFANFSFGVIFIYINASAPNRASIGATNGIAQMIVSVMRAIAPAAVNSAFSLSIQKHIMGGYFAYWLMVGMVCITVGVVSLLPVKPRNV